MRRKRKSQQVQQPNLQNNAAPPSNKPSNDKEPPIIQSNGDISKDLMDFFSAENTTDLSPILKMQYMSKDLIIINLRCFIRQFCVSSNQQISSSEVRSRYCTWKFSIADLKDNTFGRYFREALIAECKESEASKERGRTSSGSGYKGFKIVM